MENVFCKKTLRITVIAFLSLTLLSVVFGIFSYSYAPLITGAHTLEYCLQEFIAVGAFSPESESGGLSDEAQFIMLRTLLLFVFFAAAIVFAFVKAMKNDFKVLRTVLLLDIAVTLEYLIYMATVTVKNMPVSLYIICAVSILYTVTARLLSKKYEKAVFGITLLLLFVLIIVSITCALIDGENYSPVFPPLGLAVSVLYYNVLSCRVECERAGSLGQGT